MAIRIPTIERQVQEQTPNLQVPNVRPNIPQAAFGGQVGQALKGLASTVGDIGSLVRAKQKEKDNQLILDTESKFKRDLQNKLYNPQLETITDKEGNSVKQPIGLLNRQLGQAIGSTEQYNKDYEELKNTYIKDKPKRIQSVLNNLFESAYINNKDNVVTHEAKQDSQNQMNSLNASSTLRINDITNNPTLQNINSNLTQGRGEILQMMRDRGYDDKTIEVKIQEYNDNAIRSTTLSLLNNDNFAQAQVILKDQKDDITPTLHTQLSAKTSQVKQQQTEQTYNQALFAKYGFDMEKAINHIESDKGLSGVEVDKQLSSYSSYNQLQNKIKNNNDNTIVNDLYKVADSLKGDGITGYHETEKLVNNSGLDVKQKINTLSFIRKQIFGIKTAGNEAEKTQLYYDILEDIRIGKITNQNDIIKDYKSVFALSQIKSLIGYYDNFHKDYHDYNVVKHINGNLIEDFEVDEQINYWDFVNKAIDMDKTKLGRNLTANEKNVIAEDALDKITIEKRRLQLTGIPELISDILVRDVKDVRYKFRWNAELNTYTYRDENGDIYFADQEDI